MIRRILSCILSFALIFTSFPFRSMAAPAPGPSLAGGIVPPGSIGFLAERFTGSSNKRVILIQDLHAHLDTQRKIAALLKFYESKGMLQHPIGLEGTKGTWDLSKLNAFPIEKKREPFFNYLLAEASLTGPEYFSLITRRPRLLYGFDSIDDYKAQRQLFKVTLGPRRIVVSQMARVYDLLVKLENKEFKGNLKSWRKDTELFDHGQLAGDLYLKKLVSLGSRINVMPAAPSLQKALSARNSSEIASLSASDVFYSDVRKYGQEVALGLCKTPLQTNIVKSIYAADLLKRLFSQQLTFEEIHTIAMRQEATVAMAQDLIRVSGQPSWFNASALLELIRASTDFYVAALMRNAPMARNIAALFNQALSTPKIPSAKEDTAIVVAGGFHTAGITQELKKQGISYDVISPNITAEFTAADETRYAERMAGVPVSLDGLSSPKVVALSESYIDTPQIKTANPLTSEEGKVTGGSWFGDTPAVLAWEHLMGISDGQQSLEGALPAHLSSAFDTGSTVSMVRGADQQFPTNVQGSEILRAIALADRQYQGLGKSEALKEVHVVSGDVEPEVLANFPMDIEPDVFYKQGLLRVPLANGGYALVIHQQATSELLDLIDNRSDDAALTLLGYYLTWHEYLEYSGVPHEEIVNDKYGLGTEHLAEEMDAFGAQKALQRAARRVQDQSIEALKGLIANIGSGRIVSDVLATRKAAIFVPSLQGAGLNEADKELMALYFQQASNPDVQRRLLAVRELMFKQGELLAQNAMAKTGALVRQPGRTETPAEAARRVLANLQRWRRWALTYAEAYKKDNPDADERNIQETEKGIIPEIREDIYVPLIDAMSRIMELAENGEIHPDQVKLKLGRHGPEAEVSIEGRPARIGFLPIKGNPWQVGHIFVMLEAIAEGKLDKVVIMVDNSDPDRKPDLSSLTVREPITMELLKILEPFIEYTPISKEEQDLRTADGERSIFRLMEFNRSVPVEWFYMVGSDHRHWDKGLKAAEKGLEISQMAEVAERDRDTAKKLHDYMRITKPDGYADEKLGVIFIQRKGEEFEPGWIKKLKMLSGIGDISVIEQPMDTSSTRIRNQGHWWAVPYDICAMAGAFGFWDAEFASHVPQPVLNEVLGLNSGPAMDGHSVRLYSFGIPVFLPFLMAMMPAQWQSLLLIAIPPIVIVGTVLAIAWYVRFYNAIKAKFNQIMNDECGPEASIVTAMGSELAAKPVMDLAAPEDKVLRVPVIGIFLGGLIKGPDQKEREMQARAILAAREAVGGAA